jgi:hypothetical protein
LATLVEGLATLVEGLATLVEGLVAFAVRDFEACCLAASAPVAITGGRNNAQNTKSDTVAFKRFILVDRSGFAIPPK